LTAPVKDPQARIRFAQGTKTYFPARIISPIPLQTTSEGEDPAQRTKGRRLNRRLESGKFG